MMDIDWLGVCHKQIVYSITYWLDLGQVTSFGAKELRAALSKTMDLEREKNESFFKW